MPFNKNNIFGYCFRWSFIVLISLLSSCIQKSMIDISLSNRKKTENLNATVTNIQVINHQVVITGTNLNSVTAFKVLEGASSTNLQIESKSNTSIIANTLSNVTFAAGKVFDFVLSSASAASTYTVNFSLCDSTLGGKGFDCLIVPNDKDVMSFDASTNKWAPRNVNGLNYKATFDAAPGIDPAGVPAAGDYYIISGAGTINSISYAVGDWIVYNADDLVWQKVSNSKDVLSVFGRSGKISAKEGDYILTNMGDVDLTTTPPTANQVLQYNTGTGKWLPGTVAVTETDPTVRAFAKAVLPTCTAAQVLSSSDGVNLSCVTDATGSGAFSGTPNMAVVTNGAGALAVSAISDTVLGYLSGATSNIQTQINAKANTASIVDWSVAGAPNVYPTRVYGGALQPFKVLVTDVTGLIEPSAVTTTELGYLSGASSNLQTQIASKQATISKTTIQDVSKLRVYGLNATNYVEIDAPALAGNLSFTLPSTIGSASQVLTTDGAGILSWSSPSSGLPASAGTAGAPGYAFSGDTNTGMFGAAADQIGLSTNGVERVRIDASGNVGIGVTSPEFLLSLGGDGGILAKGTVGSGASLTTSGAGVRTFWYPKKAAFRTGGVSGTQWDDANVGDYSFATGYNNKASGLNSTAIGVNAQALDDYGIAIGTGTLAYNYATAIGYNSSATGTYSIALGCRISNMGTSRFPERGPA